MPHIEIIGNGGMFARTIDTHDPRILAAWLVEQISELTTPEYPIILNIRHGFYLIGPNAGSPDWPLAHHDPAMNSVTIDPGTSIRHALLGLRGILDKHLESMP